MRLLSVVAVGLLMSAPVAAAADSGSRYVNKPQEGVVVDTQTGLTWQAAPSYALTWWDATDACAKTADAGHAWQLPTIEQLSTLLEDNANDHPVSNPASLFPKMTLDCYFGTSPLNQSDVRGTAQVTCFNGLGYIHWTHNNSRNAVRCVAK